MPNVLKIERSLGLNRSNVSRYIQLATLFRRRIESGVWRAGEQIPTIDELVAETGVARATVRQALGLLEDEGLLARFRGKGTFVLERETEGLWCEVETEWKNLLTGRPGAKIELLESRLTNMAPNVSRSIGTFAPEYRLLRRLHSRDGRPFLIADVYVDASLAKSLPSSAFKKRTAMRLAESLPGVEICDAVQTVTIGTADLEVSSMLDLELNAPVAFVQRAVVDQRGVVVLLANGIYRGDVVRLEIKLK
jgi:GntR family transcriptional regulator